MPMIKVENQEKQANQIDEASAAMALALSSNQYTGIAANAIQQVESYRGWNYVGITPICRLAARATVDIFDERKNSKGKEQARSIRRSVRDTHCQKHGAKWKSFLDEKELGETADSEFRWWRLLDYRPNPWQSASLQRWERVMQLHIHGVTMTWNLKNHHGKTVWRFVLPLPLLTFIPPGTHDMMLGGVRFNPLNWAYRINAGVGYAHLESAVQKFAARREIPMEDITMTAYPNPRFAGEAMSPSSAVADWISAVNAAEATERKHFERGPEQVVLIQQPDNDGEDGIATTESLNAFQKRLDKRLKHRDGMFVAVPRHGAVTTVGFSPEEMNYARTGEYHGPNIMSAHGTPKVAIGQAEGMTYGSNAASMQAFNWLAVQSDLDLLADDDTMTMQQEEGESFTAEYTAPEYNDPEMIERQFENDINAGTMTAKEARHLRGREPYGDERDDMTAGSQSLKEYLTPEQQQKQMQQQQGMMGPGMPAVPGATGKPPVGDGAGQNQNTATPKIPKFLQGASGGGDRPKLPSPPQVEAKPEKKDWDFMKRSIDAVTPVVVSVDMGTLLAGRVYSESIPDDVDRQMVDAIDILRSVGIEVVVITHLGSDYLVNRWLVSHGINVDYVNDIPSTNSQVVSLGHDIPSGTTTDEILRIVASVIEDQQVAKKVSNLANGKSKPKEQLGFLFVPVSGQLGDLVQSVQRKIDPSHYSGNGREEELHVTVIYGLIDVDRVEMAKVAKNIEQPKFRLARKPTVFERDGHDDVAIVIEIDGAALHAMREAFASRFAHLESFPQYRPHITLGYIKREYADQYVEIMVPNAASAVARLVYRFPGEPDLVMPVLS